MAYPTSYAALAASIGLVAAVAVPHISVAQTAEASGEVVRVDRDAGKIAIRHGAIAKLDLPAMTLVYHADPALLGSIKKGDKVRFTAERANDQYRLTAIKK